MRTIPLGKRQANAVQGRPLRFERPAAARFKPSPPSLHRIIWRGFVLHPCRYRIAACAGRALERNR
jgi:hypothetical protein